MGDDSGMSRLGAWVLHSWAPKQMGVEEELIGVEFGSFEKIEDWVAKYVRFCGTRFDFPTNEMRRKWKNNSFYCSTWIWLIDF